MPAGGKMLLLHFRLQRFRCQNVQCQRLTFQQSIISIAQKYQRNTYNLNSLLVRYSLICGGEAGSRLAQLNGIRISGDTLIRRLIDFPLPDTNNLTNIGVDDWAWKKGHRYGTIIVDHDTHRPVALLQGRESAPLSEWLVHRPGIRVITRDRAGAYADGAMSGAPQAIQIADRWHLIRNACDHFERLVKRYWPSVKKSVNSPDICSAVQSETTAMPPTTISPQESVSPVISRGSELTRRFISLFSKRDSNAPATLLRKWQTDALSSGMDEYRSFITRMESDFEAIKNALMYSWSNGLVEGHVNRLKTLKRQMYGRAGFELLRRRVLIPYLLE